MEKTVFKNFPKIRPVLPEKFNTIYISHYKENREGKTLATSFSQKLESWLHKTVAQDVVLHHNKCTLEIGAGTLNQLSYEPRNNQYDIVEPLSKLYESSDMLPYVRTIYQDISEIPLQKIYDRITSIATFEHICNLPEVVALSGLLLKEKGTLRISIPSEGTILWTLGWKLTTAIEFRLKYGLDYSLLMKYEHVNSAKEIETILNYFFGSIKTKVFGLSKDLSFYQFHECSQPNTQKCRDYLNHLKK